MSRLGVFGDSWADIKPLFTYNEEYNIFPWPVWIEKKLDVKLTSYATACTGLWWSFNNFLKNYKNFEKIVFVYTEYSRWNGLEGQQQGLAYVRFQDQLPRVYKDDKEYAKKLIDVFPFLYNDDLNKFIYQNIFNEVNRLCGQFGIQLVNLLPFEVSNPVIDISKRAGAVLYDLRNVGHKEVVHNPNLNKMLSKYYDIRHCHLNPNNNKILAEIIIENFNNTDAVIDLSKTKRFMDTDDQLSYFDKFWEKYSLKEAL